MDTRDEGPFEFAHGFEDPRDTKPSFEQIALAIVQRIWGNTELDQPGLIIETRAVAEQLRQVWNARGAADVEKLTADWAERYGARTDVGASRHRSIDAAIRGLQSLDQ